MFNKVQTKILFINQTKIYLTKFIYANTDFEFLCSYFFKADLVEWQVLSVRYAVIKRFYVELAVPGMRCNASRKPPSRSTSHEVR
jgi:hypothetical protein